MLPDSAAMPRLLLHHSCCRVPEPAVGSPKMKSFLGSVAARSFIIASSRASIIALSSSSLLLSTPMLLKLSMPRSLLRASAFCLITSSKTSLHLDSLLSSSPCLLLDASSSLCISSCLSIGNRFECIFSSPSEVLCFGGLRKVGRNGLFLALLGLSIGSGGDSLDVPRSLGDDNSALGLESRVGGALCTLCSKQIQSRLNRWCIIFISCSGKFYEYGLMYDILQ